MGSWIGGRVTRRPSLKSTFHHYQRHNGPRLGCRVNNLGHIMVSKFSRQMVPLEVVSSSAKVKYQQPGVTSRTIYRTPVLPSSDENTTINVIIKREVDPSGFAIHPSSLSKHHPFM